MSAAERCDFCAYIGKIRMKYAIPVIPFATEIVETPNGTRHLCAKHAHDAVRVGEPYVTVDRNPGAK